MQPSLWSRRFVFAFWVCTWLAATGGCGRRDAPSSSLRGGAASSGGAGAAAHIPTLSPSRDEVAAALGLDPQQLADVKTVATSNGTDVGRVPSVSVGPAGLLLSTGDVDATTSDLGGDGAPDTTRVDLWLAVPPGAKALLYTMQFTTAEFGAATPHDDRAVLDGAPGGPVVLASAASATASSGPRRLRAIDVSNLKSDVLHLGFSVEDAVDGELDSTLLLSGFSWSPSPAVTAEELAGALLVDPDTVASSAALEARSGDVGVEHVVTAGLGAFAGSIFLSTGLAADRGLGDTDLASDRAPDCTAFRLALAVPPAAPGAGPMRSLVFTTRFYSAEHGTAGRDAARATSTVHRAGQATASALALGSVSSSTGRESPSIVRAIDVAGADDVEVEFEICDAEDAGRRDSGLLLSGMYFSEHDAALLQTPRPGDSRRRAGSYGWSKVLLGSSGGGGIGFSLAVAYDSTPRRTSGRMGERWTHAWDWGVVMLEDKGVAVRRGDATIATFKIDGGAYVPAHGGVLDRLERREGGAFRFTTKDRVAYDFDAAGLLRAVTDRNGNAATLGYDQGLLATVVDSRGQTAHFTHDGSRRLTGVTYAGLEAAFAYDANGNLESIVDAAGGRRTFTYDGDRNLLSVKDASGAVVTNVYDDVHRVIAQTDAKGKTSVITYSANNQVERTDRDGATTITAFDPLDRPAWTEDGTGARRAFSYDANDRPALQRDALGFATRTAYDGRGNPVSRTDPLGAISTVRYDAFDRPVERTDPLGATFQLAYDASGNVVAETNPLGFVTRATWDARGLPATRTDRRGAVTTFAFTSAGDPASVLDAEGNLTSYEHDALGRRTRVVDARGNATQLAYDGLGRPLAVTDALGGVTATTYDGEGRPLVETDQLGRTVTSTYTPTGKIATRTDALQATTRFAYTGEDRLASVADPLGRTTRFTYDATGRVTEVEDAASGTASATYDAAGNRFAVTDPRGNRTTFGHDALGRAVEERDPLGNVTRTSFDEAGRVKDLVNARGQTTRVTYDGAGRAVAMTFTEGDVTFVLDQNGNRIQTVDPGGTTTREYDRLNRLVAVTDRWGHTVRYRWDPVGNLSVLTYSDGKEVRYAYDAANRVTAVVDWEGRTTSYAYDASGRLLEARLPDASSVAYAYDAAGRLTGITDTAPDGSVTYRSRYTLDAAGRRVKESVRQPLEPPVTSGARTFSYDAANQLVADDRDAFRFDRDGNMTRATVGRVPVDLAYDSASRLVLAGDARYAYDGEGRRVEATVDGETRRFVVDAARGARVLEEHDAHGRIVARYVHGLGLVSRQRGDDRTASVYHFDSRGSTVALTDASGRITDRWAYDPYGLVVARDGDTPNRFTFNGRDGVQDDGNGLYFMGTRYYEPRLMRFLQRDGAFRGTLQDTRSLNRYAFALGDPIRYVDPSGRWAVWDDLVMMLGGAITYVAAQVMTDLVDGTWDLEAYVGAAVGGAVWGETILLTANPVAAAVAGAAAQNVTRQAAEMMRGYREASWSGFDFGSLALDVGIAAATAGVADKLFPSGRAAAKTLYDTAPGLLKGGFRNWLVGQSGARLYLESSVAIGMGTGLLTGAKARWGDEVWRDAQQVAGTMLASAFVDVAIWMATREAP